MSLQWDSLNGLVCKGTHNHLAKLNHLTIWPVWLNYWVFIYKLSGCGFESCCSHLNFRYRVCFKQGVLWYSGNCGVQIHSKKHMWHNNKKQSPCHPSYILGVCLSVQVNFILNRHLSRGHRILYRANHLERIDNKLFSGLIGPRHITASGQLPTKTGWQDASFEL